MIKGVYSANLESKDFSYKKGLNKKNTSVPQLSLRSNEPVLNYSLCNLQANYMPLNDAKSISFCGDEQKKILLGGTNPIEILSDLPKINEIKQKLISDLPSSSLIVINESPEEQKI